MSYIKVKFSVYGEVHHLKVYNATTGQVQWTYTQPSVGYLETPYPASTQQLVFFVGDYIYLQPYEGAGLSNPIRRDGKIICLNTITGEELWGLTAWPGYNPGASMPVISDGRILYLDVHTNQIYCIGKGPSATTVNAPYSVPALGSSVTITGSVTDNSPSGRLNVNEGLDFTLKGTPAISDDYMNAWMEYMFQNRPIPANAKGVEVTLETIDPNNNLVSIGTTTTDVHGNYGIAFTPEVPGTYQIIAKFAGSNSYGSSSASTYLTVGEESPTPVPTYEPLNLAAIESTIMLYVAAATVAIIIAIAIVGLLILRKRP